MSVKTKIQFELTAALARRAEADEQIAGARNMLRALALREQEQAAEAAEKKRAAAEKRAAARKANSEPEAV